MLGYLNGTITERADGRVLIVVHDIGYWVYTGSWQPFGQSEIFIHDHIREDTHDLYGFNDLSSLRLFEKLITVSGVGPKAGLALLSLGSPQQISAAIINEDADYLRQAPGIGQKVAQKIVLELKNVISKSGLYHGDGTDSTEYHQIEQYAELVETLEALGYKTKEILPKIQKLPSNHNTLEEQIKWFLNN